MSSSKQQRILRYVQRKGVVRPSELSDHGWPRSYLQRLTKKGLIRKLGRGLYIAEDAPITESHSLIEACKRVPKGVVCLLSALQFHQITTQVPFEVWLAIDIRSRRPRVDYPPLRFVTFSGRSLTEGIEEHKIEGSIVRVYNPAKTIADCFKYRNKIGLDVALEALKEARRKKLVTIDKIWRYAQICRVANVMHPFLQAIQ